RTTSDNITELKENEIFVFGSNLSGIHGKGAAKTALNWGANLGQSNGLQGNTYAIPTVDVGIRRALTVDEIIPYVNEFIEFTKSNKEMIFKVTEIGCGLAGHTPESIAPLFKDSIEVDNIHL